MKSFATHLHDVHYWLTPTPPETRATPPQPAFFSLVHASHEKVVNIKPLSG